MPKAKQLELPRLHLGARTFPNSLRIHTDLKASEYADTWKAGYALGWLLEAELGPERLQGSSVLELGSGCGYAGLVAARLGALVVLTDQEPLLQVLQKNVKENLGRISSKPSITELDWRQATQRNALASKYPHFDFILCSDVMYEEDCIEPLIAVLRAICGPRPVQKWMQLPAQPELEPAAPKLAAGRAATKVIFTLENRGPGSAAIHDVFFRKISQWFAVDEITARCSLSEELLHTDLRAFILERKPAP